MQYRITMGKQVGQKPWVLSGVVLKWSQGLPFLTPHFTLS